MSKFYNIMTFKLGCPDVCWVEFGEAHEASRLGTCIAVGESPAAPKWATEIGVEPIPLQFEARRPDGVRVTGLLRNTGSVLILHRAYCDIARKLCTSGLHFFSTAVYNHKGRVVSSEYEIVVPWPLRDVVNLTASKVSRNDDGTVRRVKEPVLDPGKVTDDLVLFRVMGNNDEYYIREDLMRLWKNVPMEDHFIFLNDVLIQAPAKS